MTLTGHERRRIAALASDTFWDIMLRQTRVGWLIEDYGQG